MLLSTFRDKLRPSNRRGYIWLLGISTASALLAVCLVTRPVRIAPTANFAPAGSAQASNAGSEVVVAKGKDFEIRRSDMEAIFGSARANQISFAGPQRPPSAELTFPPEAQVQVLNELIEMQLVLQGATNADKAEGRRQGDEAFAATLNAIGSMDALRQRAKTAGMTPDQLRGKFADDAASQLALTRQLGVAVTDEEISDFYGRHRESFDQPARARVRDLLLLTTVGYASDPLPDDVVHAKRRQIEGLLQRLRAGEDFAALARQYSEDPTAKAKGGELPLFARTDSALGDVAFSMRANALSNVVTTIEGYHVIQLLELIPPRKGDLASASDEIRKMLLARKKKALAPAYLAKLKAEAAVEIVDPQLKAYAFDLERSQQNDAGK